MVQYQPSRSAFPALADPTRRGILEYLGTQQASVSDLAARFAMTLTGIKKHLQVLETAGLVSTVKAGRVRICRLGPNRLEAEASWIARYRRMLEDRYDRLDAFLAKTEGDQGQ